MPPEEAASDIENISELLAFAEKEDSISKDQITFTNADIKIDEFVRLEWSIDEALGHFFKSVKDAKTAGDRDTTFVIMAYANRMMKSFPQKVAEFIDDLIENKNEKEIGNFYAYLEEVAISEIEIPLVDYMKTLFGEEKFASNILALNEIHGCCKKDVILRTVLTTFKEKFYNTLTLPSELAVYRSIVTSLKSTKLSTNFVELLQTFWKLSLAEKGEEEIDNIEAETEECHFEHVLFANALEKFGEEIEKGTRKKGISFRFIRKDLRSMFVPLGFKTFDEDGHHVLEVSGRKIIFSTVIKKLETRFNSKVTQLRFSATNEIVVDEDITFPGICISIVSPNVIIKGQITFDISGKDAPDNSDIEKASDGVEKGSDGQDGHDGVAGGSAGHFCIYANSVKNPEKLHVVMNGGNGNNGQDGGNGKMGEDGYGEKFNEVFSEDEKSSITWKSAGNALTGGLGYSFLGAFERAMMQSVP
uniref:Uncharacterized protein n=1 Tax=Panagrolaimus sp. PS1159 TaxID=55785 RepID=A0AC35G7J9_9BILA